MGVFDDDHGPARPRFFDDDYLRRERVKKSRKQEERLANALGGKRVPQSGAGRYNPFHARKGVQTGGGDVTTPTLLVEAKRTDGKTIAVHEDWLIEITAKAKLANKSPAMALEFDNLGGGVERDWILLPRSVVEKLMGVKP